MTHLAHLSLDPRPDGMCHAGRGQIDTGQLCPFHASRPTGLCGIHDNQRKRQEEQAAADARRAAYARDAMTRIRPVVVALTGLGIDAQPRLSGVLLTIDAAERLIARLTTTEGAAPQ